MSIDAKTVVSYRIYCNSCSAETVIRERDMEDSDWKVESKIEHKGLCPKCNPAVDLSESDWSPPPEQIDLESLDHIGAKAAANLSQAGFDTVEAVEDASDGEILEVSWVGEKGLFSLREAAKSHPPQQRWEDD